MYILHIYRNILLFIEHNRDISRERFVVMMKNTSLHFIVARTLAHRVGRLWYSMQFNHLDSGSMKCGEFLD